MRAVFPPLVPAVSGRPSVSRAPDQSGGSRRAVGEESRRSPGPMLQSKSGNVVNERGIHTRPGRYRAAGRNARHRRAPRRALAHPPRSGTQGRTETQAQGHRSKRARCDRVLRI